MPDENKQLKILELQSWERAKGELRATLIAHRLICEANGNGVEGQHMRLKTDFDRFIERIDELLR